MDAGRIRLTRGPREHRFRPAIDPLFRSVAETYGHRGIGIVLSGNMADGTHGLMTIKRVGGTAIVQDPGEALVPAMPLNAIQRVKVDYVLPTREIGKVVTELVMNGHGSRSQSGAPQGGTDAAPSPEHPDGDALQTGALPGPPSPLTCPDCGGTLWELNEGGAVVRYRCHVGHSYSTESLAVAQGGKLEDILWSALRAMEEAIELRKRIVARAGSHPLTAWVRGLKQEVSDLEQRADRLRSLLLQPEPPASRRPRTRSRKHHAKKKAR